jgi:hypothetical protein
MKELEMIEKKVDAVETILNGIKDDLAKLKEPKPEFKVGQWYFNTIHRRIYRVSKISCADIWFDNSDDKGTPHFGIDSDYAEQSRPATPAEIESHLQKICDEKYIGKKARCLLLNTEAQIRLHPTTNYYSGTDELWYEVLNGMRICIYRQGKFAEIVEPKKTLPVSKLDARLVIASFCEYIVGNDSFLPSPNNSQRSELRNQITDFLDEYEF